mmetsp:Transcript_1897/g.6775  ORF Transcript_1897/g.6775 Transcript_1897/m.6775 type:complete len:217 (-) Transcript_1897:153-803(-)
MSQSSTEAWRPEGWALLTKRTQWQQLPRRSSACHTPRHSSGCPATSRRTTCLRRHSPSAFDTAQGSRSRRQCHPSLQQRGRVEDSPGRAWDAGDVARAPIGSVQTAMRLLLPVSAWTTSLSVLGESVSVRMPPLGAGSSIGCGMATPACQEWTTSPETALSAQWYATDALPLCTDETSRPIAYSTLNRRHEPARSPASSCATTARRAWMHRQTSTS